MRIGAMKKQSQNKPNLLNAQMNISSVLTKDYENERLCRRGENKPNQTQFQNPTAEKWTAADVSGFEYQVLYVNLPSICNRALIDSSAIFVPPGEKSNTSRDIHLSYLKSFSV